MIRSSLIWSAVLAIPVFAADALLVPRDASAAVTLKGCIKWFHPDYPGEQKYALKYSEVEVHWNGVGKDPEVLTDVNGCYRASVRNAAIGFNGHDMNAQPNAKRAFLGLSGSRDLYVRVFENMSDVYPTYVDTVTRHVNDNSTGTIDLWLGNNREFGGTQENFKTGNLVLAPRKYYYWNIATADIIGRYYDTMHAKGFRQHRSVDVISPALGGTAYFNFATNNINLTASTNPVQYGSFKAWIGTLLHEATHALHAHSSPPTTAVAAGLLMPSVHSMTHETNPKLAWTEAFAEFLPVAYLTSWGGLGKYASYDYAPATTDGTKVTYQSKIEDHTNRVQPGSLTPTSPAEFHTKGSASRGGAEGYVVGFLWDLVDSSTTTQENPGMSAWRFKIPGGKPGANLSTCQLENTASRTYRGLPSNAALLRDPESVAALSKSTDCIAMPIQDISQLISREMYQDVQAFGAALVSGKNDAIKYEVLKAYANNGILDAAPSALNSRKNWAISQASTSLSALPIWGDSGRPANATTAQDRAKEIVRIDIPVRLDGGSTIQFQKATCKLTSASAVTGCTTNVLSSGTSLLIRAGGLRKSDFCNGTGNVSSAAVGASEKSPMYVALDDGINPLAIRVAGLCSASIRS